MPFPPKCTAVAEITDRSLSSFLCFLLPSCCMEHCESQEEFFWNYKTLFFRHTVAQLKTFNSQSTKWKTQENLSHKTNCGSASAKASWKDHKCRIRHSRLSLCSALWQNNTNSRIPLYWCKGWCLLEGQEMWMQRLKNCIECCVSVLRLLFSLPSSHFSHH